MQAYAPAVDRRHPVRFVDRRVGERRWQRSAALAALVLGAAGVGLLGWFAAGSLGLVVGVVAAAALALVSAFTALTSTGGRRAVGMVGLGLGLAVVVWAVGRRLASAGELDGSGAAGAVCLVAATVCGRYALRVPPPRGTAIWAVPAGGPTTRRGVVVANPRSGGGKVRSADLSRIASDHGIELVLMAPGDDPADLARAAVARGADALGVAGGDGSLAAVARVAVAHDLRLVVVPAGTRNHYALDLGLDLTDPGRALSAFVRGEEHRLDYAEVNGRMFLNNVSLGAYAAAVEQPGYRDAKVETTLRLLPGLVARGGPWFDLQLDVPGRGRWTTAALVQVSNGVYELAAGTFGRRRRLDAGELGVVAVDVDRPRQLAAVTLLAATRHPERHDGVWPWATPELVVGSGQASLGVGLDGEHTVLEPPLRFRSVPGGLRVLVPEGTPVGLDHQHVGSGRTLSGLLEVAFDLAPPAAGG